MNENIQIVRKELYMVLESEKSIQSDRVISLSQKLDKLILEYYETNNLFLPVSNKH